MKNNIAINGRCFTRRITGVERYSHEISRRLSSARIIQPKNNPGQISGNLWEQLVLPIQIRQNEILFSPANAGPWIVHNQIITIHDASVFDHPEWFKPSFAAWTRLSWKILSKRVKAIITVSNFSRERLIHHLQIPENRIHVIPNGVGKPFEPQSQTEIDAVKTKYNLNKPYFLFVGTNEPRKNLAALIQAWESLNSKTHILFFAGAKGKVFGSSKESHAASVTYISDEDLPALYSGAAAFVMPSFYEGFGLTALEAMACGAPVIASDISAFRELFKDKVLFANPHKSNEFANAMQQVIEDKTLARVLCEQGLIHAAGFSWDESAQKTKEIICKTGHSQIEDHS